MANRQTRMLAKKGLGTKFNHGVDFSHLTGQERLNHPEFSFVQRPSYKGSAVDSSFANREKTDNKRQSAWRGVSSARG